MFLTTIVLGVIFVVSLACAVYLHRSDKDGRGAYWGPMWFDLAGILAIISGAFFIGLLLVQLAS